MDRVLKFLKANRIMTLATSCDDVPRASIMEYTMVGDTMMFSTYPGSIKSRNLSKNPRISLTVGHIPVFLAIDGTATEAGQKEQEEYIRAQLEIRWHNFRGEKPKYVEDWNRIMMERYPEFKNKMESGGMRYYKVTFETAYYAEGVWPPRVIKMGK